MQWCRAFAVSCRRVLVVPAALSLALLGCAGDTESCEDCDQALIGTAGASEGPATGGAADTPSTGGAPAGGARASTGGVPGATGGNTSVTGGSTSSATGGASEGSATGGVADTPSSGGAAGIDVGVSTGGVPGATGGNTSVTGGSTSSAAGGASEAGGAAGIDVGGSTGGVPGATGGNTSLAGGSTATGPERCSHVDGPTAEGLVAQGALLLDVRTADEYASGHAQDAVNIPVEELSGRIDELPTDRAIIVYCRSGSRSAQANTLLCDQGFDVYDLGAYSNWTGA